MSLSAAAAPAPDTAVHIEEERDELRARLQDLRQGEGRLLAFRFLLPSADPAELERAMSAALLANMIFMQSGAARILKLFQLRQAGDGFSDFEAYALANYLRALMSGGFAALENSDHWVRALYGDQPFNVEGVETYSRIRNVLRASRDGAGDDPSLRRAEGFFAIETGRPEEKRFSQFRVTALSNLSAALDVEGESHRLIFDQSANFDQIVVRNSLDRRVVFVDMDLTDLERFRTAFLPAAKRFFDFNFLKEAEAS